MAFTRAQASALLNTSEMRLFDDSRANALRGFDRAALASRVERTRAARDRARDLLKRQRLAARKRGDARDGVADRTARKEALLVELLQRFSDARREAPLGRAAARVAKKAPARKAAAKKASAKKASAKKVAAKKVAAKKVAAKKVAAKKVATKKASAKKVAATKTAAKKVAARKASAKKAPVGKALARKPATRKAARRVSPERALENTRRLLEEKQARARSPQPWQSLDPVADHVPQPGFQSPQAAGKARDLHAGESRMASIHGSSSTRDRYNQGKRDHRGDTE